MHFISEVSSHQAFSNKTIAAFLEGFCCAVFLFCAPVAGGYANILPTQQLSSHPQPCVPLCSHTSAALVLKIAWFVLFFQDETQLL